MKNNHQAQKVQVHQHCLLGPDSSSTKHIPWLQTSISQALKILCASMISPIMIRDQVTQLTVSARFIEKDEILLGLWVEKLLQISSV